MCETKRQTDVDDDLVAYSDQKVGGESGTQKMFLYWESNVEWESI